jgi:preprotein translocase subunit SecA
MRKHLLEYDDVMNKQRVIVYSQRKMILEGKDLKDNVLRWIHDIADSIVEMYAPEKLHSIEWDVRGITIMMEDIYNTGIDLSNEKIASMRRETLKHEIIEKVSAFYDSRENLFGKELLRYAERMIIMQIIDSKWKDHLYSMDQLKEGVGLRAYGQKDPLVEYKREGYEMFSEMITNIKKDVLRALFRVHIESSIPAQNIDSGKPRNINYEHKEVGQFKAGIKKQGSGQGEPQARIQTNRENEEEHKIIPVKRQGPKIGRNDPCPCGSGKKYKKCCGVEAP